jgi:flagellar export protein FliJ
MPFHFPLEPLLRYRRSTEHQQELRLQLANQRVTAIERPIAEIGQSLQRMLLTEARQLQSGWSAAEMQFHIFCRSTLLRQRGELENQLAREQMHCRECVAELRRARQLREAVESLRNEQLNIYQQEAARRDQRDFDDLFLLRRNFQSHD